jgi:hypothetical protein
MPEASVIVDRRGTRAPVYRVTSNDTTVTMEATLRTKIQMVTGGEERVLPTDTDLFADQRSLKAIRDCTYSPLGSAEFTLALERQVDRPLTRQKPGPKKRREPGPQETTISFDGS